MIEVLRRSESADADWVEAGLRALVLGYDRVLVSPGEAQEMSLPAIRHDGKIIAGRENLLAYLEELEKLAEDWRRFQSDACYVDGDGDCL